MDHPKKWHTGFDNKIKLLAWSPGLEVVVTHVCDSNTGSVVAYVGHTSAVPLIAAAPELLEALRPFAVYGRPGSRDVEVAAAIAAIAKATGATSAPDNA